MKGPTLTEQYRLRRDMLRTIKDAARYETRRHLITEKRINQVAKRAQEQAQLQGILARLDALGVK
jgi:hypothetical protein